MKRIEARGVAGGNGPPWVRQAGIMNIIFVMPVAHYTDPLLYIYIIHIFSDFFRNYSIF